LFVIGSIAFMGSDITSIAWLKSNTKTPARSSLFVIGLIAFMGSDITSMADGEDSSEVLRLGEEEREVRRQSNRSENRVAALTVKGWWRGSSSVIHTKTSELRRRGWTKGTGGTAGGGLCTKEPRGGKECVAVAIFEGGE
jgi:hypothetical protein